VTGWNFVSCRLPSAQCGSPGPDIRDDAGHGTHVAGIVAAVGDNTEGIIGVAPSATILPVKALDASIRGSSCDLAQALVYAAEQGADIINVSWSGPPTQVMRETIEFIAKEYDTLIVAAVGNNDSPLERGVSPADLPYVLSVGATTQSDRRAAFSNFGGPMDLVAPGGADPAPFSPSFPEFNVLSLLANESSFATHCEVDCRPPNPGEPECVEVCGLPPWSLENDYIRRAGTSAAAPHVAGAAALLMSQNPDWDSGQVRQVLLEESDDLGEEGWDPFFGFGRVNVARALTAPAPPVAQIIAPENGARIREGEFPRPVSAVVRSPSWSLKQWRLYLIDLGSGPARLIASGNQPKDSEVIATLRTQDHSLITGHRYRLDLEVEDARGRVASDTKEFLVPNLRFATVPIPDPFDAAGFGASLSADGSKVVFDRTSSAREETDGVWLYDSNTHTLVRVEANATGSVLAPNGRIVYYYSFANGMFQRRDLDSGQRWFIHNITGFIGRGGQGVIDREGLRLVSSGQTVAGDPDSGRSPYLYDFAKRESRRITPSVPVPQDVDIPALSQNGRFIAFASAIEFDPNTTTNGLPQIFLYDDQSGHIRQVTMERDHHWAPQVSADGRLLSYRFGLNELAVIDVETLETRFYIDLTDRHEPGLALLSANGSTLAFTATADLDPQVGNPDHSRELFVVDIASGSISQATDNSDVSLEAISESGDVMFLGFGGFIEFGDHLVRTDDAFVRIRDPSNSPPILAKVLKQIRAREGRPYLLDLSAEDPDGDFITFKVQIPDPVLDPSMRLRDLHPSFEHNAQSAQLTIVPRIGQAGTYQLQIAAFDEHGGMDVSTTQLIVEPTSSTVDLDCNGLFDQYDLDLLIGQIFGRGSASACLPLDINSDGQVTGADLIALFVATR
jgi:Tol biopolymer transport system component